jgi:hypothetical protein
MLDFASGAILLIKGSAIFFLNLSNQSFLAAASVGSPSPYF